ncbi:uncharacterized protein CCOS01_00850 [Colletotrichum costaricense]|uniref:Uncharacterized protein n=2 Tax=Colletotrichum TaxID=5455 RepID=A0AAJ0E7J1_9PEZI|nr:uncharacterized protein CCOS01_00850 [Colletotrichum costaricense]KAK1539536.1 hypothetical protein CCOS01_00850 [Colletotrichum costaricense]
MPARQDAYSVSIPVSPPPPSDLSTYMRSMHQHTKRQMEAANRSSTRRSGGRTSVGGLMVIGQLHPEISRVIIHDYDKNE